MTYNFHGKYKPDKITDFKQAQDSDLKKICKFLKTDLPEITFEVYDTREGKQDADPNHSISRASARFKEMTVYRYWEQDNDPHYPHEITHLVAHTWSTPYVFKTELDTWDDKIITREIDMVSTSFMQEGLAIAVDDIVFERKLMEVGEHKYIEDWCRDQIDLMPKCLETVINLDGFGSIENKVVVPFAASFSKFLLNQFGLDLYKQMYISLYETASPKKNTDSIKQIYEMSEKTLLQSWKQNIK